MSDAMNIDSEQITGVSKTTPGVKSRAKLLKRLKSDAAQNDRQKFFLKSKPDIRSTFESETWQLLENAINAIQDGVPVSESLELLYQSCLNLCRLSRAQNLYNNLCKQCQKRIKADIEELSKSTMADGEFLKLVKDYWTSFQNRMTMIRSIFLYLDRTYLIHATEYSSIWDLGLHILRTELISESNVLDRLVAAYLDLIAQERSGNTIEWLDLQSISQMYADLGIYNEVFEPAFLEQTKQYYSTVSASKIESLSGNTFVSWAVQVLKDETEDRVNRYIDKRSKMKLVKAVEDSVILENVDLMISKAFKPSIAVGDTRNLRQLYDLCRRVMCLRKLCTTFSSYVKESGLVFIHDVSDNNATVTAILDFKRKMDSTMKGCFNNDTMFLDALKDSFASFLNFQPNKAAEIIAKFVDSKLRNSSKQKESFDELDELFDHVLTIFRYVQGKDMFDAFFKRDLAKRLLLGRSVSTDAEKTILTKLKLECGPSFTSKAEGMLKDMDASKKLMKEFKTNYPSESFNVNILTQGYWPVYPQTPLNLPPEILQWHFAYQKFYNDKYSGRRLKWQFSLGYCLLKANFPLGPRELSLSQFQAVLLLLFNHRDTISFTDLFSETGIEELELVKTVQSLCFGPHKILLKTPPEPTIQSTDTFSVNEHFEAPTFRLKVSSLMTKEPIETNSAISKQVMQNRQYQIDAAIVRILKARKELPHDQLCQETKSQLNFPAGSADIKKRIESLASREYLEKVSDDENGLRYRYI
ncbi:Cullin-domain-containing protein [Umbelopsis sp. PMI_123]|nr:Cullin-domain-containing protein [Umbelopsis sp. PMI_123]